MSASLCVGLRLIRKIKSNWVTTRVIGAATREKEPLRGYYEV